jgi:hypothetical protein
MVSIYQHRVDLLAEVRSIIAQYDEYLDRWNRAMGEGCGPYDLEPTRLHLAELRRCEKWLVDGIEELKSNPLIWSLIDKSMEDE